MVYGYQNENVSLDQLESICKNGLYQKFKVKKMYTMKKFDKLEDGRTIPPRFEDDAEEQLILDTSNGDVVLTSTLVNFSLNQNGIIHTVKALTDKGVRVVSILEDFDSDNTEGKAFLQAIKLMQRINKSIHKQKVTAQRHGIERAQREGKYKDFGRKSYEPEQFTGFEEYYKNFMDGSMTKSEFAMRLGISRPTLDKLLLKKGGEKV